MRKIFPYKTFNFTCTIAISRENHSLCFDFATHSTTINAILIKTLVKLTIEKLFEKVVLLAHSIWSFELYSVNTYKFVKLLHNERT